MGLFNYLFGSKKGVAKKLVMSDAKRMDLWKKHLSNYYKRESLCLHFSFGNIDAALQDFEGTRRVLDQIESLISSEVINIGDEEKTDREILADLRRLESSDVDSLAQTLVDETRKQALLISLFREIHNTLLVELHLMRLIRKKPPNAKELLLNLFRLINNREFVLYQVFNKEHFFDEHKADHAKIVELARAVILGKELKKEIETDEERFANEMLSVMAQEESGKEYRVLGEHIFLELVESVGAPFTAEGIVPGLKRMEKLMKDDTVMYKIVKKLKPRFGDAKIRAAITAFRKAYDFGHFEDLGSALAT